MFSLKEVSKDMNVDIYKSSCLLLCACFKYKLLGSCVIHFSRKFAAGFSFIELNLYAGGVD